MSPKAELKRTVVGRTSRLNIEDLQASHARELAGLLLPEAREFFDAAELPQNVDELAERFSRAIAGAGDQFPGETWLNFAVRVRDTAQCIGRLEATLQKDDAEVAFLFIPSAWGQGFASEATRWLMSHCVEAHQIKTFWATVSPRNQRSLNICKRLGFTEAAKESWPALASYDDGDVVFSLKAQSGK
jgi:[ribosomal protein S5]-alanine N-acetyltransferase